LAPEKIIIAGWRASGKSSLIRSLNEGAFTNVVDQQHLPFSKSFLQEAEGSINELGHDEIQNWCESFRAHSNQVSVIQLDFVKLIQKSPHFLPFHSVKALKKLGERDLYEVLETASYLASIDFLTRLEDLNLLDKALVFTLTTPYRECLRRYYRRNYRRIFFSKHRVKMRTKGETQIVQRKKLISFLILEILRIPKIVELLPQNLGQRLDAHIKVLSRSKKIGPCAYTAFHAGWAAAIEDKGLSKNARFFWINT
jgi:hypothetical protein